MPIDRDVGYDQCDYISKVMRMCFCSGLSRASLRLLDFFMMGVLSMLQQGSKSVEERVWGLQVWSSEKPGVDEPWDGQPHQ